MDHHKARNLVVVSFGRGRDVYLGAWKSRVSRELYDQLIALWFQHGRTLPDDSLSPGAPNAGLTLRQLADQFNAHAVVYYRKHGRSTREAEQIAEAVAVATELFGAEPVSQFGPLRFQQVREAMVTKGWSRPYVNKQCGRIKRAFRWGVTREMVSSAVCGALKTVEGTSHFSRSRKRQHFFLIAFRCARSGDGSSAVVTAFDWNPSKSATVDSPAGRPYIVSSRCSQTRLSAMRWQRRSRACRPARRINGMECEMIDCEENAVVDRPIAGLMRHVYSFHAGWRSEAVPNPKRPTLSRPPVSKTHEDQSNDQEKYTKR